MKRASRVLVCLTILVTLGTLLAIVAGAQKNAGPAVLERLPYSGGLLMARSIAAGRVILPNPVISRAAIHPVESCTPAPCVLPNVDASEGGLVNPVNEDPIAANPSNSMQWITGGNDYNCGSVQGFFATKDNGATFTRNCLATLSGQVGAGDPNVGYDRLGHVYIGGIDANSSFTTGQIVIAKSTNGGVTFPPPHSAVKSLSGGLTDKEWMEIDTSATSPRKNTIYISLTDFSPTNSSQITVSHSTNGGVTFKTVKVGSPAIVPAANQFTDLAIGKNGTVYVSYINCPGTGTTGDCGGTSTAILVSKSTDGGNTWSTPVVAATVTLAPDSCGAYYGCLPNTGERVSNIPVIAIDNSSTTTAGTLYLAFYNYTTFMSVEVAKSTNGGTTWSAPVKVSPASVTHDQFFPWINVSASGTIGVTFLDRRDDPANINYEAFLALSRTGTAFSNKKLATAVSNPNNDGFGGTFMGDYTGNVWNGKSLLTSWMDMRSGISQDEVGGVTLK